MYHSLVSILYLTIPESEISVYTSFAYCPATESLSIASVVSILSLSHETKNEKKDTIAKANALTTMSL
jgi:hypothetical protein